MFFLALAVIWIGYLAMWRRDSRKSAPRRADRIATFGRQLGSLGSTPSLSTSVPSFTVPRTRSAAARRRRDVLTILGVLVALTLLGAVVFGAVALFVHVVVDIAFVAYAYNCVQRRNAAAEREMKVTMLYPESSRAAVAAQPLGRVASG